MQIALTPSSHSFCLQREGGLDLMKFVLSPKERKSSPSMPHYTDNYLLGTLQLQAQMQQAYAN